MTANDGFWEKQQPLAEYKHALLVGYAKAALAKLSVTNQDRRVYFLDAYAGEGEYDNGALGSPMLAAHMAEDLAKPGIDVRLLLAEKRHKSAEALNRVLSVKTTATNYRVFEGDVRDMLPDMLKETESFPVIAFVDPFGAALTEDLLTNLLTRSGKTEVILNISTEGIWRAGGIARKSAPSTSERTTLATWDKVLGGTWWQRKFADAPKSDYKASKIAGEVAAEYAKSIAAKTGYSSMVMAARRRPDHVPSFHFVLFYKHPQASWLFADAAARANHKWRTRCFLEDTTNDEPDLFEALEGRSFVQRAFDDNESILTNGWVNEIKANLVSMQGPLPLKVRNEVERVFGNTLGLAGTPQAREAWRDLVSQGTIEGPRPTGNGWTWILPGTSRVG